MTPTKSKHERAARTVWSWGNRSDLPGKSSEIASARRHAAVQAIIGYSIGTLIFFFWHRWLAYIVFGITTFSFLAGMFSPLGLYKRIRKMLHAFGYAIGTLSTWLLLAPFYFLFFTPFHYLFRTGKKDAMTRWLDPGLASYWHDRPDESADKDLYERQY